MTNEERRKLCDWLRHLPAYLSEDGMRAADEIERLIEEVESWKVWGKSQPSYQEQEAALAQSDAKPQTLRDAAENLLIAIVMGWDIGGCAENLRTALAQSDAELSSGNKEQSRSGPADYIPIGGAGNGA